MNLNGFLDGLSREKYLVYFLLAWAGVFFFWAIDGFIGNIMSITNGYSNASSWVNLISRPIDLGAGIMLGMLAAKLLMPNFMPTIKREVCLIYFILLWAGGFFFNVISDIAYYATWGFVGTDIIGVFGTLCSLVAAGVLALFAWNQLKSAGSLAERLQQPMSQTI
ncbi:MAG: hypothetical protein ACFCUE_03275 [Candidatus Bathyarchaeia archaeon]|jgi:hypothetical protein